MGNISPFASSFRSDPYVAIVAGLVALCSVLAADFSHSCQSDGCIGVIFPIMAAVVLLVVQLVICLPVLFLRWRRRQQRAGVVLLIWTALSVAAFVLPLLFTRGIGVG